MQWFTGALLSISAVAAWLTLDFLLGKRVHALQWKDREYPLRTGRLELITNGPNLFTRYFNDLEKAESNIHVLFYIVQNDRFSERFFKLLMNKAKQGVQIKLLLDWFGSRKASKALIREARALGVEIHYGNRPRLPFLFFTIQQRNHRKITIIDGKIGYLGGYNIGKEYIDLDPLLTPWRDYHLRLEGKGVGDLQREFFADWERAAGSQAPCSASFFPDLDEGPTVHQLFPTEGVDAAQHMIRLIERAKEKIFIGTPYFVPPENVMLALEQALAKGIEVILLVPERSDHPIVKEASFPFLRRILAGGGDVYQFRNGFFHAKVIIIDCSVCDIGTANFDCRSMLLNHELNCFIYDEDFIAEVQEAVAEDLDHSTRLCWDDLRNLPLSVQRNEWIGRLLRIFL